MKTLIVYVPLESSVQEFVQLVHMFKGAGYRIADAVFQEKVAAVTFERVGV